MAVLTVQDIPVDGFTGPTFVAAEAAGDEAPVGEGVFVVVRNDSAGAVTVTARVPVAVGGVVELAPSVAAGAEFWLPLPARNAAPHIAAGRTIEDDVDDRATLAYSAVTSVTVAAVRAP